MLFVSCSFHLIKKLEKQRLLQTPDWNLLAGIFRVKTTKGSDGNRGGTIQKGSVLLAQMKAAR